ncbi:MAG: hypothetical protein WA991_03965 [Ornithinimicrobium sp.]
MKRRYTIKQVIAGGIVVSLLSMSLGGFLYDLVTPDQYITLPPACHAAVPPQCEEDPRPNKTFRQRPAAAQEV